MLANIYQIKIISKHI